MLYIILKYNKLFLLLFFCFKILFKEVKDMLVIVKDRVEELMVRYGFIDVLNIDLNKEKVVNDLLVVEVFIICILVLDIFFRGFNCLGFGDLLWKYFVIKDIVFFFLDKVEIDFEILKSKFL